MKAVNLQGANLKIFFWFPQWGVYSDTYASYICVRPLVFGNVWSEDAYNPN